MAPRERRAYARAMNYPVPGVALTAGAVLLLSSATAFSHSRASFSDSSTRCNACHSGGPAPTVSFAAQSNVTPSGDAFVIKPGQRATLRLDIQTRPGMGLGLAIVAPTGFALEALSTDTRVERQILAHRLTIPSLSGKLSVPFAITATTAACGASALRAEVAEVNRNKTPGGDGATSLGATIMVECPATPSGTPAQSAAQTRPKVVAGTTPAAAAPPTAPVGGDDAARMPAPIGVLKQPVTVSVNHRRSADNSVQFGILNEHEISATPEPGVAEFKAGLSQPGAATVFFYQGSGYVIVDCVMGRAKEVALTIDAPPLHVKTVVPIVDGHAVAVVPPTGLKRRVQLDFMGSELRWSISSCKLIPVR